MINYAMYTESSYSEVVLKLVAFSRKDCFDMKCVSEPELQDIDVEEFDPLEHGKNLNRVMEGGQDSSGSVDEVAWETDTELYQLTLDGSDLQYIELTGERLIWRSNLESLKKFVESCLNSKESRLRPAAILSNLKAPTTSLS